MAFVPPYSALLRTTVSKRPCRILSRVIDPMRISEAVFWAKRTRVTPSVCWKRKSCTHIEPTPVTRISKPVYPIESVGCAPTTKGDSVAPLNFLIVASMCRSAACIWLTSNQRSNFGLSCFKRTKHTRASELARDRGLPPLYPTPLGALT